MVERMPSITRLESRDKGGGLRDLDLAGPTVRANWAASADSDSTMPTFSGPPYVHPTPYHPTYLYAPCSPHYTASFTWEKLEGA